MSFCLAVLNLLPLGMLVLSWPSYSFAQDRTFEESVFDIPVPGTCEKLVPDPAYVEEMLIDVESIGSEFGETYERRVALVVGNSTYRSIDPLKNPGNDATAMTRVLRAIGFTVFRGIDLDAAGLEACIDDYAIELEREPADLSLFFYAGHGVQLISEADTEKRNYMLATDARIDSQGKGVGFKQIDTVLAEMRSRSSQAVFFYDACRNDPLGEDAPETIDGVAISRQVALNLEGAAVIEVDEGAASDQAGLYIAYATAPNRVADDAYEADANHSPFTQALLEHIATPGYSLQQVMSYVSNDVGELTDWNQTPWTSSSLVEDVNLNGNVTEDEALDQLTNSDEIYSQIYTEAAKLNQHNSVTIKALALAPYFRNSVYHEQYEKVLAGVAQIQSISLKGFESFNFGVNETNHSVRADRILVRNALDGMLGLWEMSSGEFVSDLPVDCKPFSSSFARKYPPTFTSNGNRVILDCTDPEVILSIDDLAVLSVDGELVARSGSLTRKLGFGFDLNKIVISPDGEWVVFAYTQNNNLEGEPDDLDPGFLISTSDAPYDDDLYIGGMVFWNTERDEWRVHADKNGKTGTPFWIGAFETKDQFWAIDETERRKPKLVRFDLKESLIVESQSIFGGNYAVDRYLGASDHFIELSSNLTFLKLGHDRLIDLSSKRLVYAEKERASGGRLPNFFKLYGLNDSCSSFGVLTKQSLHAEPEGEPPVFRIISKQPQQNRSKRESVRDFMLNEVALDVKTNSRFLVDVHCRPDKDVWILRVMEGQTTTYRAFSARTGQEELSLNESELQIVPSVFVSGSGATYEELEDHPVLPQDFEGGREKALISRLSDEDHNALKRLRPRFWRVNPSVQD